GRVRSGGSWARGAREEIHEWRQLLVPSCSHRWVACSGSGCHLCQKIDVDDDVADDVHMRLRGHLAYSTVEEG
ncbi:MAG: hypothetical protein ACPIOQ_10105, partial [Promethearchaeia archaeon]